MNRLRKEYHFYSVFVGELHAEFEESAKLEQAIKANWRELGYGG